MNEDEYTALARVERQHWFYSGKRELVRRWLRRVGPLPPEGLLVDVGAGTGIFADEMRNEYRVLAVDPDANALRFIRSRNSLPAVSARANQLPIATGSAAVLTSLDVIEHVDDDAGALREFARVVRPGGTIAVTVPALPVLWSEWDKALHHRRRYTRGTLLAALDGLPVRVRHLAYVNTFALLPIGAYRVARRWGLLGRGQRLEDQVPPTWLNGVLRRVFVESALSPLPMPLGVSLLCLLQREEDRSGSDRGASGLRR